MEMLGSFRILLFMFALVSSVNSNGQLFVGFLGYSNPKNIGYDGKCCDGNETSDHCVDMCDLIFKVSVSDLDNKSHLSPSDNPIDNNATEKFPTDKEYPNIRNPLTFNFVTWPGKVNITVDIFDQDENSTQVVDKFVFTFDNDIPSVFEYSLMEKYGIRTEFPSKLKMIFRYECRQTDRKEHTCFKSDCTLFETLEECPVFQAHKDNSSTGWVILNSTTQPTHTTECGRIEIPDLQTLIDCLETTTVDPTTEFITEEISSTAQEVTTMEFSTTVLPEMSSHNDETTSQLATTTLNELTTQSTVHETTEAIDLSTSNRDSLSTTNALQNKETTTISTKMTSVPTTPKTTSAKNIIELMTTMSKNSVTTMKKQTVSTTNRDVQTNSHADQQRTPPTVAITTTVPSVLTTVKDDDNDPMKYWPGIVGGVLGALIIVALVSYIIYIRRKRLRKRNNDIYNVNPKRWVLEAPEENGTSGKSEIALETEPV